MKKLLAILAVCFVMVSCQWWHETFSSPAECAQWYGEQIAEAFADGDFEKADELIADFEEYVAGLDEEEQMELAGAMFGGVDDYEDYDW